MGVVIFYFVVIVLSIIYCIVKMFLFEKDKRDYAKYCDYMYDKTCDYNYIQMKQENNKKRMRLTEEQRREAYERDIKRHEEYEKEMREICEMFSYDYKHH